ncbi:MAG TPA: hypothetical protein VF733_05340 [Candidatus Saccharimonadales bacterium]
MITTNEPFGNLAPLTNYLWSLQEVTERPTPESIGHIEVTDKILTGRALLYPRYLSRGPRLEIQGFESMTASDTVVTLAELALYPSGSEEYNDTHKKHWPHSNVIPDRATIDHRRHSAMGALIAIGDRLAVSGAFTPKEIEPAYAAIRETLRSIGQDDKEFTAHGMRIIRKYLFNGYVHLRCVDDDISLHPITNHQAKQNIISAWNVVGWPYGRFTKLAAFMAS